MSTWLGFPVLLLICLATCYQDYADGRAQKLKEQDATYEAHVNEMGGLIDESSHFDEKEKAATYKAEENQMETPFDESMKDEATENKTFSYNVPAHNNLDKLQVTVEFKKDHLLYYNFITPRKLLELASYKTESYSVTDKQLLLESSTQYGLLLRIPLLKEDVLSPEENLTVKIVVAQNITIGNNKDSDINYGISDGQKFMGMELTDPHAAGYKNMCPCSSVEGTSGLTLTDVKDSTEVNPDAINSTYPGQFEITLKPSQQWGSCYIAYESGNTWQDMYQSQLSLDRGLSLEVYSDQAGEHYGIKYVAITVMRDF